MSGIVNYHYFVISSLLMIMSPGVDFLYVLTRGVANGRKAGVLSAVGIGLGLLLHTAMVALGLSAIIKASSWLYNLIKIAGACYLIYLGAKTFIHLKRDNNIEQTDNTFGKNALKQGFLTNLMNPKAIVVFLAYLPQFVAVGEENPVKPLFILGVTLTLLALAWFVFLGFFAGTVGVYIQKNLRLKSIIAQMSAAVMILLGFSLLFLK